MPLGIRPRSDAERLRMAEVMRTAPARVGLTVPDDGWAAACLSLSGHDVVWQAPGPKGHIDTLLARLGLPPLAEGPVDACLGPGLAWDRDAPPGTRPSPRRAGPLVTILICTYNRATLIGDALRSALAQGWPCEVLVVDDGSTDDTQAELARHDGIRVLRQTPNQGKPAALARGVAEARGAAILVLDDDDLLLPDAVAVLATALFADTDTVAVWADTIIFDGDTDKTLSFTPACRMPPERVRQAVLTTVPAMPGATLVRTSAWRSVMPLDTSLIRGQDMDLFLALSGVGPIRFVPLPTFRYRSHPGLRGSAAGQWKKQDQATHRTRFLACVRPVFRRRWTEASPIADRAEGHAWALGLHQRDLFAEARQELARWPGPWTESEAWIRSQIGIPTRAGTTGETLVVVDDGDDGALEACLAHHPTTGAVYVDLEVPRDPLGLIRLFWQGNYMARAQLCDIAPGVPVRLCLSSAPTWSLPLDSTACLPRLPGPDAVMAWAAAVGALPERSRAGLTLGPVARRLVAAREALDQDEPMVAMAALEPVLPHLGAWPGGWRMAAAAFAMLGLHDDAARCAAHGA